MFKTVFVIVACWLVIFAAPGSAEELDDERATIRVSELTVRYLSRERPLLQLRPIPHEGSESPRYRSTLRAWMRVGDVHSRSHFQQFPATSFWTS